MKKFFLFLLLIGMNFSQALIPPLSEKELMAKSEVVIEGKVVAVILTSHWRENRWEHWSYRAWILVTKIYKSNLSVPTTLEVSWKAKKWVSSTWQQPIGGSFEPIYYPGEKVKAYLCYNTKRKAYVTVHWNGKKSLQKGFHKLPTRVGEIIFFENNTKSPRKTTKEKYKDS